jgi:arylsulfatase A-like enzyme
MPSALALLPLLLAACSTNTSTSTSTAPSDTPHPNILVLVPDSLRADRVSTDLPGFGALAQRGCVFEQGISQSGWTLPALASMLTGHYPLLPSDNQAQMHWIDPEQRTVPEILGLYGYHSVAWWGGNLGSMASEFSRGFTEVRGDEKGDPILGDSADVLAWLADDPPQPFLAFVHDVDLQFVTTRDQLAATWPDAAERIRVKPDKAFWTGIGLDELHTALADARGRVSAREPAIAAYDAVVAAYDQRVADTMATLEAEGLATNTVIVLISPHGIHLGEGGSFRHGTLDEPDLAMPLIIAPPGQAPCRSEARVQTLDLAPTLLAIADVPADQSMVGRSLVPLLAGEDSAWGSPDVFSMNSRVELALIRDGRSLSMRRPPPGPHDDQPVYQFVTLGEPDDRPPRPEPADRLIAEAEDMLAALEAFRTEHAAQAGVGEPGQPADALRQALQDRGYWEHVQGPEGGKPPE